MENSSAETYFSSQTSSIGAAAPNPYRYAPPIPQGLPAGAPLRADARRLRRELLLFPDLQVLFEGPHFVAEAGGGGEVEIGSGLVHLVAVLLDQFLNL